MRDLWGEVYLMTENSFLPVEGCFNVQHIEFDWDYCRPELDVQLNEALSSLTLCKRKPDGRPFFTVIRSNGHVRWGET